jgi:hypothetical protein
MRHLAIICALFASIPAIAQMAHEETIVPTQVKHLKVLVIRQTDRQVTYRVVNEYDQPLTSYTVGIDFTYGDGTTNRAEVSGEWTRHPIDPGASFEQSYPLDGNRLHGLATSVSIVPLVAIYGDGTAEATDEATLHRIADHRVMVQKAHEVIVAAVQQALNDAHPSAKALAAVKAAIAQSDAATAGPGHKIIVVGKTPIQPDEGLLKDAVKYLEGVQGNSDERGELSKYLATEQEKLNQARGFAQVHVGGVQ